MNNVIHLDFSGIHKVNKLMDMIMECFEKENPNMDDSLVASALLFLSMADTAELFEPDADNEDIIKALSKFLMAVIESAEAIDHVEH